MKKMNFKNLKFGLNNTVIIAFAIIIVIMLNVTTVLFETRVPDFKIDLTESKVTKIGNETKAVLKKLDEGDLKIDLIYLKGISDAKGQVTSVLEQYDAFSENIEYKVVNYHSNPVLLNSYGINSDANVDGSVLVAKKDKSKARIVQAADMERQMQTGTVFMLENLLTNAIAVLSDEEQMTVCFSTGHGEIIEQSAQSEDGTAPSGMMLVALLRSENIGVYQFDISTGKIPEGIDLVMIMSPMNDFTQQELDNLDDYLLSGGNAVVSLPSTIKLERLEKYLETWGIEANNDIVSETDAQSRFDESGVYFYAQKTDHEAVRDISGRMIASYMKSLSFKESGDIEADVLFTSSDKALSMPITDNGIDSKNVTEGKFNFAYLLEKPLEGSFENSAKMVVTSGEALWGVTREMVTNYDVIIYNSLLEKSFGNADFVMNILSYIYGKDIQSIYVPVKTRQVPVLTMSQFEASVMSKLLGFVLPFVVILMGVIVWLKRRNK